MKEFLKDFSAEKIVVKYHLIKPNFSKKQRTIFTFSFVLLALVFLGTLLKILSSIDSRSITLIFMIAFLIILGLAFLLNKFIGNYTQIGQISFNETHLHVESKEEDLRLNYDEIIKIEYFGSIPKSTHSRTNRIYYTYKVKFYTGFKNLEFLR